MSSFLQIIGATAAAIAGNIFIVPRLLSVAAPKPLSPAGFPADTWERLIDPSGGGKWIGLGETLLILVAFWIGQHVLIAGWFALKVAAKWESWKNITQVPDRLQILDEVDWLVARHAWGSWSLTRFLVGTLANVGIAFIAFQLFGPS